MSTSEQRMDEQAERRIKNLQFKVDTTPSWMGRFIYERMLRNAKANHELYVRVREVKKTALDLCYHHQQEANRSHFSSKNCDHCAALRAIGGPLPDFIDDNHGPKEKSRRRNR